MRFFRFISGRQSGDSEISRELDERERQLYEQQRRLARILHLRRERDLYERRDRSA